MIRLKTHMLLRHYLAEGLSKADIARRLGINARTIRRWIVAGELDRDLDEPPRYKPRPPRPTKLDPYREIVRTRLADYPELSAVRLFEEVRAAGYTGSYAQVRDFVRQVRPRPAPSPSSASRRHRGTRPRSTSPSSTSPGASATRSSPCWGTPGSSSSASPLGRTCGLSSTVSATFEAFGGVHGRSSSIR